MTYFFKSIDFLSLLFLLFFILILYLRYLKYDIKLWVALYIVVAICCTTSYFPKLLIYSIEHKQKKIDLSKLNSNKKYYIVVLGSSNNLTSNKKAFEQLHSTSKGRLIEAIRIKHSLKKSILITLGASFNTLESNASMMKRAAIEKEIPAQDIEMIETPTSTIEEANSIKIKIPKEKIIILVTDALHMPRASKIFKNSGYFVIRAPTNYLVDDKIEFDFPNFTSFELAKLYFNTQAKQIYYNLSLYNNY